MQSCASYAGEDLKWHPVTAAMSKPGFDESEACKDVRQKKGSISSLFKAAATKAPAPQPAMGTAGRPELAAHGPGLHLIPAKMNVCEASASAGAASGAAAVVGARGVLAAASPGEVVHHQAVVKAEAQTCPDSASSQDGASTTQTDAKADRPEVKAEGQPAASRPAAPLQTAASPTKARKGGKVGGKGPQSSALKQPKPPSGTISRFFSPTKAPAAAAAAAVVSSVKEEPLPSTPPASSAIKRKASDMSGRDAVESSDPAAKSVRNSL